MRLLMPIAASQRDALRTHLTAYLTELKDLVNGDWDPADYPFLDVQWSDWGRHPFFICDEGVPVGFTLVRDPQSTGTGLMQLSEFYIQPTHRGTGIASLAACAVLERFPGTWELQVHQRNPRAIRFWRACIDKVAEGPLRERPLDFDGELKQHMMFVVPDPLRKPN